MADDHVARARAAAERIVDELAVDADVEVTDDGETLTVEIVGDDLGLVIGRHGQTIDAIQHLVQRVAFRGADERRRVIVDAAGYRERRAVLLQGEADRAADDAVRNGRPVALDTMSALERRVVHEHLRDRDDVETYSEGQEPDRYLVVAPLG
jgi:spoIIIJ-associated protein